ncbi:hypothetical protein ABZT06_46335, partial [Streptomyces sp. NPDC005483]
MSSSAQDSPRFDPRVAAQQMLDLHFVEESVQEPFRLPAQACLTGLATPLVSAATGPDPHAAGPVLAGSTFGLAESAAPLPPSLSDRGNARLFVRLYRDQFRHVEGLGWFAWDG